MMDPWCGRAQFTVGNPIPWADGDPVLYEEASKAKSVCKPAGSLLHGFCL